MKTPAPQLPRYGKRIVLRRLTVADLADFQAYRHDEQVGMYQGWVPLSDADATEFLKHMSYATPLQPDEWLQIGIADADSNQLIGDIGICVNTDSTEALIGFSLRAQSQGQGLATEAVREAITYLFGATTIDRLLGYADMRNLPSIRLLERLNMHRIDVIETVFRGEPCQEAVYAISREAYFSNANV